MKRSDLSLSSLCSQVMTEDSIQLCLDIMALSNRRYIHTGIIYMYLECLVSYILCDRSHNIIIIIALVQLLTAMQRCGVI